MSIKRTFDALILKHSPHNHGLLFNDDPRDRKDEVFGATKSYTPKHDSLSFFRYQYNQNPNNTCTQCATALAMSEQMSVRFSIDAITKMMVQKGKISGNGFASQQPPMSVVCKHGLIPEHLFSDATNLHWRYLKMWDAQLDELYRNVADRLKMEEYRVLKDEAAVLEALDNGFVPIVASDWTSKMNNPLPPYFYLDFGGYSIGGHQYRISGYRKKGEDFENGQSFGSSYGDGGKAFNETLFGSGYFKVYYIHYNGSPTLPTDVLLPYFLAQHEGLMVKAHDHEGDPRCYVIQNGKKHWVSGEDDMKTFFHLFNKIGLMRVNKTLLNAVPSGEEYPLI